MSSSISHCPELSATPRRRTTASTSSCRWRNSTASAGNFSARSSRTQAPPARTSIPGRAIGGLPGPPILFWNLAECLSDRQDRVADQPGILDRRLAVLDRFAIDGISDHLDKRGDAWIFGDETMIPTLFLRPDQHQFKPALPDDQPAEPRKHRFAFPAVGRIGFRAA